MLTNWPIKPMELVIRNEPYDSEDTIFQVKWDGVRCLAYVCPEGVHLFNRKLNARDTQYPELISKLSVLPANTVLDGEIIVLGPDGKPSFPRVLSRDLARSPTKINWLVKAVPIHYMVFDVLWLGGKPLHALPLIVRIHALEKLHLPEPARRVDSIVDQGKALFNAAKAEDLEGIVAKRMNSPYRFGERSPSWEKIKCLREVDGLIGGYIPKLDGMRTVLIGIRDDEALLYIGKASSGPTHKEWSRLKTQLSEIPASCPFANKPPEPDAVWVQPILPIRVRFMEYTGEGLMRAPAIIKLPV